MNALCRLHVARDLLLGVVRASPAWGRGVRRVRCWEGGGTREGTASEGRNVHDGLLVGGERGRELRSEESVLTEEVGERERGRTWENPIETARGHAIVQFQIADRAERMYSTSVANSAPPPFTTPLSGTYLRRRGKYLPHPQVKQRGRRKGGGGRCTRRPSLRLQLVAGR